MSVADTDQTRNQVEALSQELAALTYSISHDLTAPLRGIAGFSDALYEDYADSLDNVARDYLERIRDAAVQMEQFIAGLTELSRVSRADMRPENLDVTAIAEGIANDLRLSDPARNVHFTIERGLITMGDPVLIQLVFRHVLGNAWRFTSKRPSASIEVGAGQDGVMFVRDDGAGFDQSYADKLFGPFQRLHSQTQFPGVGIGLSIVRRIVNRHGGRVWATGEPDRGATIYIDLT
jgi:light-regulated signal transduction histidine kinase (bacteriophytochrome)